MICHKWPFRWNKEARFVWDGLDAVDAAARAPDLLEKREPEKTDDDYQREIRTAEESVQRSQEKIAALESTQATTFIKEVAQKLTTEHATEIAKIAEIALAEQSAVKQTFATELEQIADLGEEVEQSSQTLDVGQIEMFTRTADVEIVNADDIEEAELDMDYAKSPEEKKQRITEKVLTGILEYSVKDPQVLAILENDPQYTGLIKKDADGGLNITDRPKLIEKIIKKEFEKDLVLNEGDMLILTEENGALKIHVEPAEKTRQSNEAQQGITARFVDAAAKKLQQEYHVGVTKTADGQKLSLPAGSDPAEFNIPNDATDIKITGDEEEKQLIVTVTKADGTIEKPVTIQLPETKKEYGSLPETHPVKGVTFEGDWETAEKAMNVNQIKLLPTPPAGKISIAEKTWSFNGKEEEISVKALNEQGTKCTITIRESDRVQTLTIDHGKVTDNVTVLENGTVLRKAPGTDPALKKAGGSISSDGRTLETKRGRMDLTRGGTLTNTEISMDGDTVVVRGIDTNGEITRYTVNPKTEPKKESITELPRPNMSYDRGATKLLEAQGFAGGEIHFATKQTDNGSILVVQTNEIPPGTTFKTSTQEGDAKALLAQNDISRFKEISIDKKGPTLLEVTGIRHDGETEEISINFAQTKHEVRKEERQERRALKKGVTEEPVRPKEKMPECTDEDISAMKKNAHRVPNESRVVQIDTDLSEERGREIGQAEAKKDLTLKTCAVVFGPEFNFNNLPINTQAEILKTGFVHMQTEFYRDEEVSTAKAQFRENNGKERCMALLTKIKTGTEAVAEAEDVTPAAEMPKLTLDLKDVTTELPTEFNTEMIKNITDAKDGLIAYLNTNKEQALTQASEKMPTEGAKEAYKQQLTVQIEEFIAKITADAEALVTVLRINKDKPINDQKIAAKEATLKFAGTLVEYGGVMNSFIPYDTKEGYTTIANKITTPLLDIKVETVALPKGIQVPEGTTEDTREKVVKLVDESDALWERFMKAMGKYHELSEKAVAYRTAHTDMTGETKTLVDMYADKTHNPFSAGLMGQFTKFDNPKKIIDGFSKDAEVFAVEVQSTLENIEDRNKGVEALEQSFAAFETNVLGITAEVPPPAEVLIEPQSPTSAKERAKKMHLPNAETTNYRNVEPAQLKNEKMTGPVFIQWPDGNAYIGNLENGLPKGDGLVTIGERGEDFIDLRVFDGNSNYYWQKFQEEIVWNSRKNKFDIREEKEVLSDVRRILKEKYNEVGNDVIKKFISDIEENKATEKYSSVAYMLKTYPALNDTGYAAFKSFVENNNTTYLMSVIELNMQNLRMLKQKNLDPTTLTEIEMHAANLNQIAMPTNQGIYTGQINIYTPAGVLVKNYTLETENPKVELHIDEGVNEALTRNGWNIDMNTLVLNKGGIKIDLNGTTTKNKRVEITTLPDNKLKLTSIDVNNLTETYILDLTENDPQKMLTKETL